jgi:hypothetical protein
MRRAVEMIWLTPADIEFLRRLGVPVASVLRPEPKRHYVGGCLNPCICGERRMWENRRGLWAWRCPVCELEDILAWLRLDDEDSAVRFLANQKKNQAKNERRQHSVQMEQEAYAARTETWLTPADIQFLRELGVQMRTVHEIELGNSVKITLDAPTCEIVTRMRNGMAQSLIDFGSEQVMLCVESLILKKTDRTNDSAANDGGKKMM